MLNETFVPAHIEYGFEVEPKNAHAPIYRQVHGSALVEVKDAPHLVRLLQSPPEADGAFCTGPNLELYVFTADCLPVLFYSDNPAGPIATVHCGWRGAKAGIVQKTVQSLNTSPDRLHAILGPAILGCCFEVREDFIHSFHDSGIDIDPFLEKAEGRYFFSLVDFVVATQLNQLPEKNIHMNHVQCTYCSAPPLPSFRRNKETDPRIRSWIVKQPIP